MRCVDRLFLIIVYTVVISQVAFATYMYCEDSDSGSVYDIQGTVSYGFKTPLQTVTDFCDEGATGKEVTSCSGNDCFIVEYSCSGSAGKWNVETETENCVDLGYTGCVNGACTGTPEPEENCSDGIQNRDEEGVDCGGAYCDPCITESCSDGIQNQDETDVDCGGSCSSCTDGEDCSEDSDCVSSYCNPDDICATPSCDDEIQNRDEEGIDCGGAYCDPCITESCSDGIQNQDETDVDCGGSCYFCEDGQNCNTDLDCSSSYCNPDYICATPSCDDGIQNRDEEGIDCGGAYCDACTETISDSELLMYIELWAQGALDPDPAANNQKLLEVIDIWKVS